MTGFQWAPTLGGECYLVEMMKLVKQMRFNGHPPLGVNATEWRSRVCTIKTLKFQWAPTLGGECYSKVGSNEASSQRLVSMGTHPWG